MRSPRAGLRGLLGDLLVPGSLAAAADPSAEAYAFGRWPWEAGPEPAPAPSLREALLMGSGPCLTRWVAGPGKWEVEARGDGLDTLLHFTLESLDRLDAMAELFGGGSPEPLCDALNVLVALAGEVAEPVRAARIVACIRSEAAAAAAAEKGDERLLLEVLVEVLDPDPLAAAQSAQQGVLRVAAALGIGPRAEITRWQEEVLLLATPWRPAPPDLGPLVDPLIARREREG